MHILKSILGACISGTFLAACGGASNSLYSSSGALDTPQTLSRRPPLTAQGHLYVGVFGGGTQGGGGPADVVVYPLGSSKPAYTISKGITGHLVGMAFDPSGNLYVGLYGSSTTSTSSSGSSVVVYGPGQKKPSYTIALPPSPYGLNYNPLLFDSTGNLYVLQEPQVLVYAPGAKTPLRMYPAGGFPGPPAMALDGSNDFYVAESPGHNNPPFDVSISVYAPESTSLLYKIKVPCLVGSGSPALAAAPSGTLYVTQYYCSKSPSGQSVTVFAPGERKRSYILKPPSGPYLGALDNVFFYSGNLYATIGSDFAVYALGNRKATYHTTCCGTGQGDIAFDSAGNIYESNGSGAAAFAPGQQSPSYEISGLQLTDSVAVGP
jgi:hypothetical protein